MNFNKRVFIASTLAIATLAATGTAQAQSALFGPPLIGFGLYGGAMLAMLTLGWLG